MPAVAVELTVNVTVLVVLVLLGLKAAVTPLGKPEIARFTLLLRLLAPEMVTEAVPELPRAILIAAGEADMEKPGWPLMPARSLMSGWPAGDPQPVTRSYPLTAEKPLLLPLLISFKSAE